MTVDHETLTGWLTRLKLTAIRDQLDNLIDEAARREFTLREALAFLCEREIARKDERRIAMAVKIAHFPCVRDLDGFDFAAQPSLDPRQIRELAACRWVAHGEALLLLVPPGVGNRRSSAADLRPAAGGTPGYFFAGTMAPICGDDGAATCAGGGIIIAEYGSAERSRRISSFAAGASGSVPPTIVTSTASGGATGCPIRRA
jgi:hypothetical protein